jgi:integrase
VRPADYIPRPVRRPNGSAVVRLSGKDFYLGQAGDWPKARRSLPANIQAEYDALVRRWLSNGRSFPSEMEDPTVNDVLLAYDKHAELYYHREGRENTQLGMIRDALRVVKDLFGRTQASEFGPKKLKAVQQAMAEKGWSRNYMNEQIDRVRRCFKWAVAEEMVPGDLYHALKSVPGLPKGTKGVRETEPVKPVPEASVEVTLPFLPPVIRAMVRLQLLTGMRPTEVCIMRACDIDMTGRVWVYRPHEHKTQTKGKRREVYIGPRGQEVIRPWLTLRTEAYLFSPAASEQARNAERRANRQTPMTPSQARRKRCAFPKRPKRDRYDETSYRNAVYRACDKAFHPPAPLARLDGETKAWYEKRLTGEQREEMARWRLEHRWHPNQLRHTTATLIRKDHGIEMARIVLGHSKAFTTEIYAETDQQKGIDVMAKLG